MDALCTLPRVRRLTLSLILALGAASSASAASAFTGLYVFGDSLSDNGNLFALTGSGVPDPVAYPSSGRFSNGPVAVEYLATTLGLNNPTQFHDLAIAGAETGLGGSANAALGIDTGMQAQVAGFHAQLAGAQADSQALYVVWGGANDLLHADSSVLADPLQRAALIGSAITNLVGEVTSLYQDGARNFLLPTLPDLGLTPRVLSFGALASAGSTAIALGFNQALLASYDSLAAALAGEHFTYFDTFTASHTAAAQFANATTPCLGTADVPACTGYMFFDDIHPTTATHQLLGTMMAAQVPEPSSMLLLAVGSLALLGWARRRG